MVSYIKVKLYIKLSKKSVLQVCSPPWWPQVPSSHCPSLASALARRFSKAILMRWGLRIILDLLTFDDNFWSRGTALCPSWDGKWNISAIDQQKWNLKKALEPFLESNRIYRNPTYFPCTSNSFFVGQWLEESVHLESSLMHSRQLVRYS